GDGNGRDGDVNELGLWVARGSTKAGLPPKVSQIGVRCMHIPAEPEQRLQPTRAQGMKSRLSILGDRCGFGGRGTDLVLDELVPPNFQVPEELVELDLALTLELFDDLMLDWIKGCAVGGWKVSLPSWSGSGLELKLELNALDVDLLVATGRRHIIGAGPTPGC